MAVIFSSKFIISLITAITLTFAQPNGISIVHASETDRSEQEAPAELTSEGTRALIQEGKTYGPIDAEAYMSAMLGMSAPDSSAVGKDKVIEGTSRESKMFNSLVANNWIITRTVLFGMSHLDSAADLLEKGEYITQKYDFENEMKMSAATGTKTDGTAKLSSPNSGVRNLSASEAYVLNQNKQIASNIRELASKPGIGAGNSIYDRTSILALALLAFTFALRLGGTVWTLFLGSNRNNESPGILFMGCVFRFMLCAALILFLKWAIAGLMMFSELVRNVIIATSSGGGGVGNLSEQLQTLLTTRNLLTAGEEPSLFNINLLNQLGQLLAWCVSRVFFWLTGTIITVMVILGDVMMAITAAIGPFVIAISMIKGFEGWLDNFIRSSVQFSFYLPIAGIYMVTMCIILALVPDIGFLTYMAISWAFLLGAMKIPNLAEALSGTALATMMTAFVGKLVTSAILAARLPFKFGK